MFAAISIIMIPHTLPFSALVRMKYIPNLLTSLLQILSSSCLHRGSILRMIVEYFFQVFIILRIDILNRSALRILQLQLFFPEQGIEHYYIFKILSLLCMCCKTHNKTYQQTTYIYTGLIVCLCSHNNIDTKII